MNPHMHGTAIDLSSASSAQRPRPQDMGSRTVMVRGFRPVTIDDSPQLLETSHRLRYQAYCLERRFLNADDYPDQLEFDDFDPESVHVGVLGVDGQLAGTARIVKPSSAGLP